MKNKCWNCGKILSEEDLLTKKFEICEECAKKELEESCKNDPNFSEFF